jgi:hypothetical protein
MAKMAGMAIAASEETAITNPETCAMTCKLLTAATVAGGAMAAMAATAAAP